MVPWKTTRQLRLAWCSLSRRREQTPSSPPANGSGKSAVSAHTVRSGTGARHITFASCRLRKSTAVWSNIPTHILADDRYSGQKTGTWTSRAKAPTLSVSADRRLIIHTYKHTPPCHHTLLTYYIQPNRHPVEDPTCRKPDGCVLTGIHNGPQRAGAAHVRPPDPSVHERTQCAAQWSDICPVQPRRARSPTMGHPERPPELTRLTVPSCLRGLRLRHLLIQQSLPYCQT